MNTIQRPAFASPELQAAFDDAREALEGSDEARNRVSTDIRALETYIVSLGLTPPFRYSLGRTLLPDDEQNFAASLEYGGTASGKIQEDTLLYGEDEHGKLRLLYEVCQWDGYVDVDTPGGPYFWDVETLERDLKPLIETKFGVRKQVYSQLPAFIGALAKHYDIKPNSFADLDGVPF
jgi:hypothetical protein